MEIQDNTVSSVRFGLWAVAENDSLDSGQIRVKFPQMNVDIQARWLVHPG